MRNRWYEPYTGRFVSEDPVGLAGGINPYVFAGGDPTNGSDPSGLAQCYWADYYTEVGWRGDDGEYHMTGVTFNYSRSLGCSGSGGGSSSNEPPADREHRHASGNRRGSKGTAQPPTTPRRTSRQCFAENTAPVRQFASAMGVMGGIVAGGGAALMGRGNVLAQDAFLTRSLAYFRWEAGGNGIGPFMPRVVQAGPTVMNVGIAILAGVGAYAATSAVICALYPEY
jgi:hypothetical protein